MTPTQHTAYRLFAQTVILLLLYGVVALLGAVQFVDYSFLARVFPYHHLGAMSHVLLHLAIFSGLLGGGVYIVSAERADGSLKNEPLLRLASTGWTMLLALSVLAGMLGLLDAGRYRLEMPVLLDLLLLVTAGWFVTVTAQSVERWSAIPTVWTAGMTISLICAAVGLFVPADVMQENILRALVVGINLHVGWVLAAVALGFWLMHRFSNITPGWAEDGLYVTAGLLALAGLLVSLSPLYTLGISDLLRTVGSLGVLVIPLALVIFAAHSYRALSDRNPTRTLAAHWFALALVLLMLGMGIMGAVNALPGVNRWTQGTRLSDLQYMLTALAVAAILLGVINQAAAELRAENRRVTGLLPFWLVSFGGIGGGLALAGAGLAQVYLERIFSVGYLDVQRELAPLYQAWIGGLVLMLAGLLVYALGFRARRPDTK